MTLTTKRQFDTDFYRECNGFEATFEDIFRSENPHMLLRNLKFGRKLFKLFPEFEPMVGVYQKKKRNQSLFDHSVKVLEYTYDQTHYFSSLVAAFLHDFGKIATADKEFKDHDRIGIKQVLPMLSGYGLDKETISEIKLIMMHHPSASQYQREPNWTDSAIRRFIRKTHPLTMEVISVAKADKRASHDYGPYLAPYDELRQKCIAQFESGLQV